MGNADTKFTNSAEEIRKLTRQLAIKKEKWTSLGSSDCQRFEISQETQKMKLTVWSMTGRVDGPQGTEQSGEQGYKTGWRRGERHLVSTPRFEHFGDGLASALGGRAPGRRRPGAVIVTR